MKTKRVAAAEGIDAEVVGLGFPWAEHQHGDVARFVFLGASGKEWIEVVWPVVLSAYFLSDVHPNSPGLLRMQVVSDELVNRAQIPERRDVGIRADVVQDVV